MLYFYNNQFGVCGTGRTTEKLILNNSQEAIIGYYDNSKVLHDISFSINKNIALDDFEKISKLLDEIKIEFKKIDGVQKVYLNGKDVSLEIRTKPVNENVSPVSTIKIVRERLAKLQREMAETIDVIMEGRDIGTNVFPNANVKIYLDATPEERARRRYLQNKENGIEMPYEEILESVKNRDFIDSTREIAPLKKADDAIYVDSSNMTIDEVVERIKKIISEKRK